MNLNEKCLLKFLTNPLGIFNQENELIKMNNLREVSFSNINVSVPQKRLMTK